MLRKFALSSAAAVLCAGVVASAQAAGAGQQPPQTQRPAAEQMESVTIEGCVYKEQDIPGRTPNVAERAGVLEDYILVASTTPAGMQGATGTAGTTPTTGATAVKTKLFKLEHVDDSKLSALVGKRVQVTGKVDAERGDTAATGTTAAKPKADRSMGPDQIELAEFEVSSITETTGECPPKPDIKK